MFNIESTLADACGLAGRNVDEASYRSRAEARKSLIQNMFFDEESGSFVDLLLPDFMPTETRSLAAAFPLFFGVAAAGQADRLSRFIEEKFLKPGGWVTTLTRSGQQWDAPNGWAPLQWIVYTGLKRYGYTREAGEGALRWVQNNQQVYERTGRLLEKYNVEEVGAFSGGGEYSVQHGFGWTNGVLLSLMDQLGLA